MQIINGIPYSDSFNAAGEVDALSLQMEVIEDFLRRLDVDMSTATDNTHVILDHLHTKERWYGKLAVQTATDWADDSLTPFQAISGNGVYGADANDEALVIGEADTPINGSKYFDVHRILFIAMSTATVWKFRVIYGHGTMAESEAAFQYSEVMLIPAGVGAAARSGIIEVRMPKLGNGTKIWIKARNATDNATADFFIGVHHYDE